MSLSRQQLVEIENNVQRVFPAVPRTALMAFENWLHVPTADICAQSLVSFEKPYGRNYVLEIIDAYGISCAHFNAGHETSLLRRYEHSYSRPGEPHRLKNVGRHVLQVLEIFHPPLLDDKVRFDDRYGRAIGEVTREQ
jgi:hypothetical protein